MGNSTIQLTYEQAEVILKDACQQHANRDFKRGLELIDQILLSQHCPPGTFYLKSLCFEGVGWPTQSLQAASAELLVNPGYAGAAEQIKRMNARLYPPGNEFGQLPWNTALPQQFITHFEHCSHRNLYRGVPLIKNVFDLALYPMLLWDVQPRTIIEIGSCYGGSAMWMADMTMAWGLDTHVYSVDLMKVWTARHDRVSFIQGDGRNLATVFSDPFLADLPRPLLVIEDADHSYITTKAVTSFFHTRLKPGEYMIVEDVMTMPNEAGRALQEFLNEHPSDYLVDRHYCDFFGTNVTWCVNGFLKRKT
jgi:cephalosporin hydroxylase